MLEPGFLAGGLVELKRQSGRLIENRQPRRVDLDGPGGQIGILIAFGANLDDTGDRHAELGPQTVRLLQDSGVAEHHLRHPGGVAQVDEDDTAVVTSTRHPTGKRDAEPGVVSPQ